jgi:hypothetical protein
LTESAFELEVVVAVAGMVSLTVFVTVVVPESPTATTVTAPTAAPTIAAIPTATARNVFELPESMVFLCPFDGVRRGEVKHSPLRSS